MTWIRKTVWTSSHRGRTQYVVVEDAFSLRIFLHPQLIVSVVTNMVTLCSETETLISECDLSKTKPPYHKIVIFRRAPALQLQSLSSSHIPS